MSFDSGGKDRTRYPAAQRSRMRRAILRVRSRSLVGGYQDSVRKYYLSIHDLQVLVLASVSGNLGESEHRKRKQKQEAALTSAHPPEYLVPSCEKPARIAERLIEAPFPMNVPRQKMGLRWLLSGLGLGRNTSAICPAGQAEADIKDQKRSDRGTNEQT
eukprot:783502-Rhodomonas_salina.1